MTFFARQFRKFETPSPPTFGNYQYLFLPFPVHLQSLPFTFWSTSTVLWGAGPPKGFCKVEQDCFRSLGTS